MDELVAFITARLDEDQALAMSAAADVKRIAGRPNWSAELAPIVIDAEDPEWAIVDLSPFVDDECLARHIARHDPARVLREVAAKRAMIASLREDERALARGYSDVTRGAQLALLTAMRHIAAVWSDHPDYSADWKP